MHSMMLPRELQTVRLDAPKRAVQKICDSSTIAYVITDDQQICTDIYAAVGFTAIRTKWFTSAADYLAYKRPEIVSCLVISHQLSDMSGLELQRLLAPAQAPPIIFVSDQADIPSCVRAMKEGAQEFLTLPMITTHLLDAMEAAFRRDRCALVLRQENEDLQNRWRSLTLRETEVMRYVVDGFLNKQTAGELSITENTVQVHRGRVMRKMRAYSLAALVCMAIRLADCGEHSLLHAPVSKSGFAFHHPAVLALSTRQPLQI